MSLSAHAALTGGVKNEVAWFTLASGYLLLPYLLENTQNAKKRRRRKYIFCLYHLHRIWALLISEELSTVKEQPGVLWLICTFDVLQQGLWRDLLVGRKAIHSTCSDFNEKGITLGLDPVQGMIGAGRQCRLKEETQNLDRPWPQTSKPLYNHQHLQLRWGNGEERASNIRYSPFLTNHPNWRSCPCYGLLDLSVSYTEAATKNKEAALNTSIISGCFATRWRF
ncbi:hypothetical protein Leryth_021441 [Lithospermum erythrorhizon]|nr:hypothetical protein Leryth_021441 [Lithospermum erythrorhizon]